MLERQGKKRQGARNGSLERQGFREEKGTRKGKAQRNDASLIILYVYVYSFSVNVNECSTVLDVKYEYLLSNVK